MQRLTLSFDNGPLPGTTERVLDALAEHSLEALFFMVGSQVAEPEGLATARRVRAAGHRIGNHTLSHGEPLGAGEDRGRSQAEIDGCQEALGELADPGRLFRPNGMGVLGPHLLSRSAVEHLCRGRYTVVTWNCVPEDWVEPSDGWVSRALARIEQCDWTLLVLHDNLPDAVAHLPRFLASAIAMGVEFTTELPPSCVAIEAGERRPPVAEIVAA